MPWIPKGKELRRIRNLVGWTRAELVRRSKVGLRTIAAIESANPPPTIRLGTLDPLSAALTTAVRRDLRLPQEVRDRGVPPEDLATWSDGEPDAEEAAADLTQPASAGEPRAAGSAAGPVSDGGPRKREIAERAAIERRLGRHAETVTLPSGTYPLLGADRLIRLDARFVDLDGALYVVSGRITQLKRITGKPARVLNAARGEGAVMLCVERVIAGKVKSEQLSTTFYMTVFAPKAAHGRLLMEMEEKELPITVLTRVHVRDYDEKNGWKGFFVFEDRPHPWPFALVVEEVVS